MKDILVAAGGILSVLGGSELIKYFSEKHKNKKNFKSDSEKTEFDNKYSIFEKSLEYLKGEVEDLKAEIKDLKKNIEDKNETIRGLKDEINTLQNKVKVLEGDKMKLLNTTCYNYDCPSRNKYNLSQLNNTVSTSHMGSKTQE